MEVRPADASDIDALALLLRAFASHEARELRGEETFAAELGEWCERHRASHTPFLAFDGDEAIGMAWLAVLERVPRPGLTRFCGDVQSVFVLPERRGEDVGLALVQAVLTEADRRGLSYVTVHSAPGVSGFYERAGLVRSPDLLRR